MDIVQQELIETAEGWKTAFLINLTPEELLKLKSSNNYLFKYFKGYEVFIDDRSITISRGFKITEPWEDETPEAVVKSIKIEIEHIFRKIIG